jgi:hypothetical protein
VLKKLSKCKETRERARQREREFLTTLFEGWKVKRQRWEILDFAIANALRK